MGRPRQPDQASHVLNRRPVLPLRGVVLLPGTTKSTPVSRPLSVAAVEVALAGDGTVFVVAQKDIAVEEPGPDDVYRFGALARVTSLDVRDDGTIRIDLVSLRRAEAKSFEAGKRCWWAELRFEPRSGSRRDRVEPAMERLLPVLRRFARSRGDRPAQRQEWRQILQVDDAAQLADTLGDRFFSNAINWDLDIRPRQAFLEILALHERLEYLRGYMADLLARARVWRAEEKRKELDGALNEPLALAWHRVDDLLIWKHRIRSVQHARLPLGAPRPNPLALQHIVVASVFSPGVIYAVDRLTGERRWKRPVGELGHSTVYSACGLLYGGTSQALYALDPSTGEVRWRYCPYGVGHEYIYSSPVVHGGRLFLGDRAGRLHCLDAQAGKLLWWKQTSRAKNKDVNATAIVEKGLVIIATNAGFAAAYACETGERVWKQQLDKGSIHELQRFRGGILVNTGKSVYRLDPADGTVKERWTWPKREIKAFCAAGDTLLFATEVPWHPRRLQSMKEGSDLPDTTLLHGVCNKKVVFERPGWRFTSSLRWDRATGLVYESRLDGFGIIDPRTGDRLHGFLPQRLLHGLGLADVRDGTIYLLSGDGVLYALRHPD